MMMSAFSSITALFIVSYCFFATKLGIIFDTTNILTYYLSCYEKNEEERKTFMTVFINNNYASLLESVIKFEKVLIGYLKKCYYDAYVV